MKSAEALLILTRMGIGTYSGKITDIIDWTAVHALAEQQGLTGVLLDAIDNLPTEQRPPKELALQWIGEVLHGYEFRYELCCRAIADLAAFFNAHEVKVMVLKGYACSLNWPKPAHRPVGDIDIWQFGEHKKGNSLIRSEKRIKIDNSLHHHTVFNWQSFSVENHSDFINKHHHKGNIELEKLFKDLGNDDSYSTILYGEQVYLPSPNLHALFLIKHAMTDFASVSVSLRQLLDWAFHVRKYSNVIDWKWLLEVVEKNHMAVFYNCINAICVEDLGFSPNMFPKIQYNPFLKEKVLNDILFPRFSNHEPSFLLPRLIYKYKRWKANKWKLQLCYDESSWSAFWHGVWNHILKPSSL